MADMRQKKKIDESAVKRRRRTVLLILGEVIACLLLGIVAYAVSILNSYRIQALDDDFYVDSGVRTRIETMVVTDEAGKTYVQPTEIPIVSNMEGYRNILVLGVDENGYNTDVIIIVSINNETGEIRMVSVLRDTLMRFEEGTKAYPYGKANDQYNAGISETVSMFNRNFGLNIREYVVVNWFGVATCVNQLGGIEMELPNNSKFISEFNGYLTAVNEKTGIWAPQIWEPGVHNMSGTQVVAYCRIRHVGMDWGRAANQRIAIEKMLEKAKSFAKIGDFGTLIRVAQTALGNITTNMKLPDIMYLAMNIANYSMGETKQFPENMASTGVSLLASKYGLVDVLVAADFAGEVKKMHAFLFDETDYVPSSFIQSISDEMLRGRSGN